MAKETEYDHQLTAALVSVFKESREAMGLSQSEVAKQAGLSRSYIADFERGMRVISIKTLSRLASGLGLPASKLVGKAERQIGLTNRF